MFDPNPFADRGWIRGQRLQEYVNAGLQGRRLEDLPRRTLVVATRRDDKTPRFFLRGNAGVEYEDGDESLPLAVSVARACGARFVLAVDVSARHGTTPADASQALRERDRRRRSRIEPDVAQADFRIHPDLPYDAGPFRSYFEASRQRGEAEARQCLPALRLALQQGLSAPVQASATAAPAAPPR